MKKNIGKIAVIVTAALVFTACASNSENIDSLDEEAAVTATKPVTTTSYAAEITTVEVEENTAAATATSSTTATPSATTATQATTTTTAPVTTQTTTTPTTTPAPQVTTTTTTKPVETAPVYDCKRDGHKWEVTYVTSEPKWCREMHNVYDFGFDSTLARRLYPNLENPYLTYKETLKAMGVNGASGSATIDVEVWGTETDEYWYCSACNSSYHDSEVTITPIGEWRFVNGINNNMAWSMEYGLDFNILFYDPYNVPQKVIDNINLYWLL